MVVALRCVSYKELYTQTLTFLSVECSSWCVVGAWLQVHMNLHNNVRPFSCDICGRRFAQLGNLQKHMAVHTGERPHQCSECSRGFSDASALRRHCAAVHEREARYSCDTCGKKFLHLSSMRSHRMLHDGLRPHYCHVCLKTFSHRSGYLRHCRSHKHSPSIEGGAPPAEDKKVTLKPGEFLVYLTEWWWSTDDTPFWLSSVSCLVVKDLSQWSACYTVASCLWGSQYFHVLEKAFCTIFCNSLYFPDWFSTFLFLVSFTVTYFFTCGAS